MEASRDSKKKFPLFFYDINCCGFVLFFSSRFDVCFFGRFVDVLFHDPLYLPYFSNQTKNKTKSNFNSTKKLHRKTTKCWEKAFHFFLVATSLIF